MERNIDARTGDALILCCRDGKPLEVVIVTTVTPFRIYTETQSFELNGISLDGERILVEKTPELMQELEAYKSNS